MVTSYFKNNKYGHQQFQHSITGVRNSGMMTQIPTNRNHYHQYQIQKQSYYHSNGYNQSEIQQWVDNNKYLPAKQFKILISHNRPEKRKVDFTAWSDPLTDDNLNNILIPDADEHPLEHTWTFWYLKFGKNFSWEHSQVDVATFSTVETFWGIFDGLLPLTETHHGCNYSIFKKGIRPIWEDPENRKGGRFIFSINKDYADYKSFVDSMWIEFCMLIIGNSVPEICQHICGIVGGNRNNQIKIAVWTRDSQRKQDIFKIGQFLKKLAHYDKFVPYEVHMDLSAERGGGRTTFNV